ncbi:MAG: hypothetical protein NVSMB19_08810 [Vulcanimicrobiaceae bacterium]
MQSTVYHAPRNRFAAAVAVFTLLTMLVGIAPRPARADKASTTAVLLGGAAAAAAIIISNNVRHKQAQANTTVGRTQDGGRILGDGRVVYPNGDVLYTGNGNGQPCTYDGYGAPCNDQPTVYYPRDYNGGNHGHHYGDRHNHDGDDDEHGNNEHGHHHGDRGQHGDHNDNHEDDD